MPRLAPIFGGVLLAVALAGTAHAEVWAYRDKNGVTHYADRPLHARYELLYPGSGNARTGGGSRPTRSSASAVTRMELSTRFKAVRHLIREAASQHGLEFELLQAVIAHWKAVGHTSVAGLRESFLQREGRLTRDKTPAGDPPRWRLRVQTRGFDVLLDRLPWSFQTIRLPWMQGALHVEWR